MTFSDTALTRIKTLDVSGFGHAPVDVIVNIDEHFLEQNGFIKSACNLIDREKDAQLQNILPDCIIEPGGACANVLSGISMLGGRCVFNSRLAEDKEGKYFRRTLEENYGVAFSGPTDPTARCDKVYILTTPDLERTFGSFYDVSKDMSTDDVDRQTIASSRIFYIEGFMLNVEPGFGILSEAISIAREHQTLIAFCPNDVNIITKHPDKIRAIAKQADILLMNEQEAKALSETDNTQEALRRLSETSYCGSITRGSEGALFYYKDQSLDLQAPELPGPLVNTNGAGDQFAAGFLFGLTKGCSLEECAKLAQTCAAEVVTHPGARPQKAA